MLVNVWVGNAYSTESGKYAISNAKCITKRIPLIPYFIMRKSELRVLANLARILMTNYQDDDFSLNGFEIIDGKNVTNGSSDNYILAKFIECDKDTHEPVSYSLVLVGMENARKRNRK